MVFELEELAAYQSAYSILLILINCINTAYKRFNFGFFSFFKYVTAKKRKKVFVEWKMRASKLDFVMSAEILEMILVYGENYASTKTGINFWQTF